MRIRKTLFGALLTTLLWACVYTATEPPRPVQAASQFAPIACQFSKAFSSATSIVMITHPSTTSWIYICNFAAGSIGGSAFSIVEGTGTTCGTNTAAMAGGTTAAAGFGMSANGSPVQFGSGVGTVMRTITAGDDVCLIISGTGPLAGTVAYDTTTIQQ